MPPKGYEYSYNHNYINMLGYRDQDRFWSYSNCKYQKNV